jgi:cysteine desulfurase family protein (TIGR01976 family)
MSAFWERGNSNIGGKFSVTQSVGKEVESARAALADLFNAPSPDEVSFGQNMTSLAYSLSRSLARGWQEGDNIVLTKLDHDANVSPWLIAADERGVEVRWVDLREEDCTLDMDSLDKALSSRTKLVAVTAAANSTGTIPDMKRIAKEAHAEGALVFADAVHYVPHCLVDVKKAGVDFLSCSAYKFFGPHVGILWGKRELLESLKAYKVRPAPEALPWKWETGTQNLEGIVGTEAAVAYLENIGRTLGGARGKRRRTLEKAYELIGEHERALSKRFLEGIEGVRGLKVHGITDAKRLRERTPTFAVEVAKRAAPEVAEALAKQGIFVWSGHYYAVEVMKRLGMAERGGLTRVSFVHYNTEEECERVVESLLGLSP